MPLLFQCNAKYVQSYYLVSLVITLSPAIMSRAASKSRADKGRGPATPAPPPTTHSQDVVDIIPGRLTQSFWMTMIGQEEGEEVVRDILDDLMTHVMEKCKEVYLKQQVVIF